ncbi:hypothetical protein [Alkaliphilus sp. B6464]|uniref:hypothetical protein n=1 Tax=Alkaliphilus sp. B6464 TaxID=2731219 RepID=UPI001BA9E056|nr:hypothetical protein [Alkaliphilus sp. B6464]QUH21459.1 hypothetical protein HYG84_17255 [Alkaliphilus sp. B6464]
MKCYYCLKEKSVEEFTKYEPEGCCSGRDCGCMGQPINPPICDECLEESIEISEV